MPVYLKSIITTLTLVATFHIGALSQACDCPAETSCKPCSGGYTSLTLRYDGSGVAVVFIEDGLKILTNTSLSPHEEFTISGSKKNEKFADKAIPVLVNGFLNTTLGPGCNDVKVGLTYGEFTVVAAESIGGRVVCCTTPPPDVVPPEITNLPDDIVIPVSSACSATVVWEMPSVRDNCQLKSITSNYQPGSSFPLGTTTVTYSATDEAGLVATASFTVTVVDNTKPIFDGGPGSDIEAYASESCSATVLWTEPRVNDDCSIVLDQSHKPGDVFAAGTTRVTYHATDWSGNKSTFSFNVIVKDKNLQFLNCPADVQLTTDENALVRASWIAPTTNKICESAIIQSTHKPGDLFSAGRTEVEYTASTPSGKYAACTFDVIVTLEQKLVEASKLITPDGDGVNDDWFINNIEQYRDNQVLIFDRWGGVIFQASKYDNESVVWRGTNKSGGAVPTGTYFYTITASNGNKRIQETGAIELVR